MKINSQTQKGPFTKRMNRDSIKSYRSVSLLSGFSKTYKTFFYEKLTIFTDKILDHLSSTYSNINVSLKRIED